MNQNMQGGFAMDILIKNAKVVDGTGVPAYAADIAVTGGRISQIGQIFAQMTAKSAQPNN